jgi:glycosyltransferase A (GT-A) superfamily protein (DUF2064 family)
MIRVRVAAAGVLAPGLPDWSAAREVLGGRAVFEPTPLPPIAPASLPAAERRRSSPTVRLALAAAEQALAGTTHAAADMAQVFASAEAAGVITHQLCEALAGTREVSPTQFHNSVHNAPSGYYGIAMNAKLGATSICRGPWTFAAGLLAAAVQAVADEAPVLFVCYDSPLPAPLSDAMPVLEPTAVALVLEPAARGGWELAVAPGMAADAWPAWMPATWHANAAARGFAVLELLADPARGGCSLPLSPDLGLRVSRC